MRNGSRLMATYGALLALAVALTAVLLALEARLPRDLVLWFYAPALMLAAVISGDIHNFSGPVFLAGCVLETFLFLTVVFHAVLALRRLRSQH